MWKNALSKSAGVKTAADYEGIVGVADRDSWYRVAEGKRDSVTKQDWLRVPEWGAVHGTASNVAAAPEGDVLVALGGDCFMESADTWKPVSAHVILEDYIAGRFEGPEQLFGHFSIAIVDGREKRCMLAADRYGVHPLFYAVEDGVFHFATQLQQVTQALARFPQISIQAVYEYIYFRIIPGPDTLFSGIRRLQPGEEVVFSEGVVKPRSYWRASWEAREAKDAEASERELFALLESSVKLRLAGDGLTGAFLSGGLDSSTISGLLSRQTSGQARTYSIGFDAPGYDEMEYARLVARHFGTKHSEYYVTPRDVVDAVPLIAEIQDQPFGKESIVPAYYCAAMARSDGVQRLLAGDGGDELFGGNAHYARQQLFSLYGHVPQSLRRGVELIFLGSHRIPLTNKIRSYLQQARVPLPRRLETYNLLERIGRRTIFVDEVLEEVDAGRPMALLEDAYFAPNTRHDVNRMLALDLRFILADGDLVKVNMACQLAGVEVAYPMLDDRLVAFAGSIPPREKFNYPRLRVFYKKAMRDFLPKETLSKRKQGFGLPFGCWLRSDVALRELVGDSFAQLAKRRVFRREFLDDLSSRKHAEHAAYYGEMIWILMMLEQWLSAKQLSLPIG